MQVSVEKSGAIERKLTVSIPHAEVNRKIEERLRSVGKRARIPGFRPGKAPHNIIVKRYGEQVTNEVISDTINDSYREALGKEDIVPAGLVSIEPKPFVAGDDFQYVATIELFPEIPSPTLAGRTIEKPVCEVGAAEVEQTLEDIRKRNAEFTAREGASEKGDRLTIDFDGKIDGAPFAGGSAEGHQFMLGEGAMLEAFDAALSGVSAGESKRVDFTFPEDYPGAEVAGKAVEFAVAVKAVERPVLPSLDDAFAEKMGITEGGMATMREQIEAGLKRELAARTRSVIRDRVMNELVEANPIEAPKALVEGEIDRRLQALNQRLTAQGLPAQEAGEIEREALATEAKRRIVLGLIARDIIEKAGLKADAAVVRQKIEEMAAAHTHPGAHDDTEHRHQEMVNWYYADPARLEPVESMLLEEQLVARMLETATVVEKKVEFKELMNLQGGGGGHAHGGHEH